jgi:predicted extracellular nuclease
MKNLIYSIFFLCSLFSAAASSQAQSRTNLLNPADDPRGPAELTVCSQNLENYGSYDDAHPRTGISKDDYDSKEEALVKRFAVAHCDVIAAQEILAKGEDEALKALSHLADLLRAKTNRFFDVKTGYSSDKMLRVGFLVAKDRAEILNYLSYARLELPRLTENEKPRDFSRGPLEIQLQVKPLGESTAKNVTLVNFHFKSRRGGQDDPAGLEWETFRMEMAEALRRIVTNRHARTLYSGSSILLLLGDRNSHFDTASAKILEGALTLNSFKGDGACRLSKRGVPLCQAGVAQPQKFFSVLVGDPQTKLQPGTERFKNVYSWIDDILMPAESLPFAWERFDSTADYSSGVVYEPKNASDHAMVWVKLNW